MFSRTPSCHFQPIRSDFVPSAKRKVRPFSGLVFVLLWSAFIQPFKFLSALCGTVVEQGSHCINWVISELQGIVNAINKKTALSKYWWTGKRERGGENKYIDTKICFFFPFEYTTVQIMYEMRWVCKSSKASQQPQTWLNRKAVLRVGREEPTLLGEPRSKEPEASSPHCRWRCTAATRWQWRKNTYHASKQHANADKI